MSPLVSILVPCFNAERWITTAIESALEQTWNNCEVIAVDDGSTDRSPEIIASYGERILSRTGPNRGGNAARNQLLKLSRGEWVQYLDADDYLLPSKIENQMSMARSDADVIFSPSLIERDGEREELPIPEPHDDPWVLLARWFLPQTGSPLWRRRAVEDAGGWALDQPCCQEHELYLRLLQNDASFRYSPGAGSVYRKWSSETVCERDPMLVTEQRLAIKDKIQSHLGSTGQLTPARLAAINQARFELARSTWAHDRKRARAIMRKIRESDPAFSPSGAAGPAAYKLAFRALGFSAAEHLAALVRS